MLRLTSTWSRILLSRLASLPSSRSFWGLSEGVVDADGDLPFFIFFGGALMIVHAAGLPWRPLARRGLTSHSVLWENDSMMPGSDGLGFSR